MPAGVKIGDAFVEVHADSKNAFNRVGNDASAAGSRAGGLFSGSFKKGMAGMAAGLAGVFAAAQIGTFFKSAITGASDLAEETSKSQVVFGDSAADIQSWAKNAVNSFGLTKTEAISATGNFGNMFTQMGIGQKEAANLSKGFVGMAADLGSFNNLPTQTVLDGISGALRGEYDSLQAVIPGINAARVEQEALALSGKSTADALTEQDKVLAINAILAKDGSKAAGDFARTQGGLAGQTKKAQAGFTDMATNIGTMLLPIATGFMDFINTGFLPAISNIGSFIQTDVIPAFDVFAGYIRDNVMPIVGELGKIFVEQILPKLQVFGDFIVQNVLPVLGQIGSFITTNVLPFLGDLAEWFVSSIGTIMSWAPAIAAILFPVLVLIGINAGITAVKMVAAWVLMSTQSLIHAGKMAIAWLLAMGPIPIIIAIVVGLVAIIIANWDTISKVTQDIFNNVMTFLRDTWNNIVNFVTTFVNNILTNITNIFNAVWGFIVTIWNNVKNFINTAWSNIVTFVSNGVNNARNIIINVFNAVLGFVRTVFSNVVNAISTAFSNAYNFVSTGVNNIRNFIRDGFNAAIGLARDAFNNVSNAVRTGINTAVDFVRGLPGKVTSAIGNLGSTLLSSGQSLIQGFIDGITSIDIGAAVGGVLQSIRDLFPFSPAKEGPFSGRGYTTYSGKALAGDFADSIKSKKNEVASAAKSLMNMASGELNGNVNVTGSANKAGNTSGVDSNGTIVHIDQVVIDASKVKDFNDVVNVFSNIKQTARSGGNARVVI